jgi:hypothetical protein
MDVSLSSVVATVKIRAESRCFLGGDNTSFRPSKIRRFEVKNYYKIGQKDRLDSFRNGRYSPQSASGFALATNQIKKSKKAKITLNDASARRAQRQLAQDLTFAERRVEKKQPFAFCGVSSFVCVVISSYPHSASKKLSIMGKEKVHISLVVIGHVDAGE